MEMVGSLHAASSCLYGGETPFSPEVLFVSLLLSSTSWLFHRWEEEKYEDGIKWRFLEHKGPYFPPEYQPLPDDVKFYYNGSYSDVIKI